MVVTVLSSAASVLALCFDEVEGVAVPSATAFFEAQEPSSKGAAMAAAMNIDFVFIFSPF